MDSLKIKDCYIESTVLVTGGSGYLGKALVEKLLRSCTDIKFIYVVLRNKKGVSSEDRLEQLKTNQVMKELPNIIQH